MFQVKDCLEIFKHIPTPSPICRPERTLDARFVLQFKYSCDFCHSCQFWQADSSSHPGEYHEQIRRVSNPPEAAFKHKRRPRLDHFLHLRPFQVDQRTPEGLPCFRIVQESPLYDNDFFWSHCHHLVPSKGPHLQLHGLPLSRLLLQEFDYRRYLHAIEYWHCK